MTTLKVSDLVLVLGIFEGSTCCDIHLHDRRRAQIVDQHSNLAPGGEVLSSILLDAVYALQLTCCTINEWMWMREHGFAGGLGLGGSSEGDRGNDCVGEWCVSKWMREEAGKQASR